MLELATHIVETKQGQIRAGKIRRRIRGRFEGPAAKKEGRKDRAPRSGRPQRRQPDGCVAQQSQSGRRAVGAACQDHQERPQAKRWSARDAAPIAGKKAKKLPPKGPPGHTHAARPGNAPGRYSGATATAGFALFSFEWNYVRAGPGAFAQRRAEIDRPSVFLQNIGERLVGQLLKRHHPIMGQKVQRGPAFRVDLHPLARHDALPFRSLNIGALIAAYEPPFQAP